MTQQEILNSNQTKTAKIQQLLGLGLTRKQTAEAMGVGYGFVQNVYAKLNGTVRVERTISDVINETEFNFILNHKFGVEIEALGVDRAELERALNQAGVRTQQESYNHNDRNYWKIVSDGSLSGQQTFELVSPILQGEIGMEELKKVCRVLKQKNAKINKSCGLHIHFDAANFNLRLWKNLYKNYAKLESAIDSFMPLSRRGSNNKYCKSMNKPGYEQKIDAARNLKQIENAITNKCRYYKLNSQAYWRHHSIEFRQHNGTIEFEKISNWIMFLARFIEYSKNHIIENGNFETLRNFLPCDTMNYFERRKRTLAA